MASSSWPVDAQQLEAARAFLRRPYDLVALACHSDADGLCGGLILKRLLEAHRIPTAVVISARGEHIHATSMRRKVMDTCADALVVVDMGTRAAPISVGLPTLVVDHHDDSGGVPPDALVVNGFGRPPVATSSVLAYALAAEVPGADQWCWIGALGAIADLGTSAAFASLLPCRAGGRRWSRAVALLNAARRAPQDDARTAFDVLEWASNVADIVEGSHPGVRRLEDYRAAVAAEMQRCSRVPPRKVGAAFVIRFASAAQVHPLVAMRWTTRLAPAIVIAANDHYLPGRVNFAVRCAREINLLDWLRSLPFEAPAEGEYAHGHPRATGGSLTIEQFEAFLWALRQRG